MAHFDLVCLDCKRAFTVLTRTAIRDKQKVCPECGSTHVRQTFTSFLRNGALSDPACGAPQRSSGFG